MEKSDEARDIASEDVAGILILGYIRQVKRIKVIIRVQGDVYEASADSLAKILVFVFRINDNYFGPEHHRAQDLKFHGITFSGAGFCEDHHVGVFHLKAVKQHETVVVQVYAVENAGIRRKIR